MTDPDGHHPWLSNVPGASLPLDSLRLRRHGAADDIAPFPASDETAPFPASVERRERHPAQEKARFHRLRCHQAPTACARCLMASQRPTWFQAPSPLNHRRPSAQNPLHSPQARGGCRGFVLWLAQTTLRARSTPDPHPALLSPAIASAHRHVALPPALCSPAAATPLLLHKWKPPVPPPSTRACGRRCARNKHHLASGCVELRSRLLAQAAGSQRGRLVGVAVGLRHGRVVEQRHAALQAEERPVAKNLEHPATTRHIPHPSVRHTNTRPSGTGGRAPALHLSHLSVIRWSYFGNEKKEILGPSSRQI